MKRNATLNLKGLDPDVLDAARDVARRAGVPLETWIASVVEPQERSQTRRKRRPSQPADTHPTSASQGSSAPDPTAAEMYDQPIADAPTAAVASVDPGPLSVPDARVDASTRAVSADLSAASSAQMPGRLDGELSPATEMSERLAAIEHRMIELSEQLAKPRPLGRRGRPVAVEMSDAVGEIRQRQRELEELEAAPGAVATLQQNVAAGMAAAFRSAPSSAIHALQVETNRLRECIGGLATGQDVNALEQAMLSLAAGVQQAEKPADLTEIVAPIERMQAQVSRLAADVAENVHARIAEDVERLAATFDRTLSAGPADPAAVGGLFREIEEIRRLIAALAGPERIQSLAHGVQALSAQIAKLQDDADQDASRMAELRPLLEEIRSDLKAPKADGIALQIHAMGLKLDALHDQTVADASGSEAIIGRIDALSDKVDRVGGHPVGDLIGRLDDLGETLRRPTVAGDDLATIQSMLHDLVEKVDRVGGGGSGHSGEGLDALEKQILVLSQRIETRGSDPAIAGLEKSMKDLLSQVSLGQGVTPSAKGGDREEIGVLRAALSDLRTQQAASEQRMQATLNGVHTALDRLATHFGGSAPAATPQGHGPASARAGADTVSAGTGRAHAASRRPEVPRGPSAAAPDTSAEWSRTKDEILEPGSARPGRSRLDATSEQPELDATGLSTGEIKSNFIAAARRAALAAQAEAAEIAPKNRFRDGLGGMRPSAPEEALADAGATPTRAAQLRAGFDKRRKHLLLGLAAIVLALGAFQGIRAFTAGEGARTDDQVIASTSDDTQNGSTPDAEAVRDSVTTVPEKSAVDPIARPDPQTTQSISKVPEPTANSNTAIDSAPAGAKPASRKAVPRVAEMGSLSADLGVVPPALATLKAAAVEGDGAAIYELAARSAEGRGVTRDLALAAKLFEKLSSAGYAPAQYKLAGHYEKGLGLTRDLVQAKLWYGRAADQGNVRSMHNLAVIFAENPSATGKPDFATAAQWFRRGAEHGVRDSQYNLAVLYARGLGVQQDLVQSYAWFAAAAAQGDDDAGKKRDDVTGKLAANDLSAARALATAFKAKAADPATNEPPAATAQAAMTLLGAPAPTAASAPRRI